MQVSCQYGHVDMTGTRHMIFFCWDERKSCTNSSSHQAKMQGKSIVLQYFRNMEKKYSQNVVGLSIFAKDNLLCFCWNTWGPREMEIQVNFHLFLYVFIDQMLAGRSSWGGSK